jgi:hypothetical protein
MEPAGIRSRATRDEQLGVISREGAAQVASHAAHTANRSIAFSRGDVKLM